MTSTITATPAPGDSPGQSQSMDVIIACRANRSLARAVQSAQPQQASEYSSLRREIHSNRWNRYLLHNQPNLTRPLKKRRGKDADKKRLNKLARIMLEVLYQNPSLALRQLQELSVNQAVLNFASFASQFSQLSEAQHALPDLCREVHEELLQPLYPEGNNGL